MDVLEAPSHSSFLLEQLHILQQSQLHCDVTLTADGGTISAHKVVLMAASSYFQISLSANDPPNLDTNRLIDLQNTPLGLIERVVNFIYSGKLIVCKEDFDDMFKLCKELGVTSAICLLENYKQNLDRLQEGNIHQSLDSPFKRDGEVEQEGLDHESDGEHEPYVENDVADQDFIPVSEIKIEQIEHEQLNETVSSKGGHAISIKLKTSGTAKRIPVKNRTKIKPIKTTRINKLKKPTKAGKFNTLTALSSKPLQYDYVLTNTEKPSESSEGEQGILDPNSFGEYVENLCLKTETEQDKDETNETSPSLKKAGSKKKTKGVKGEYKRKTTVRKKKQCKCTFCNRILTTQKRLVFHMFRKHDVPLDESQYKMYPCTKEGCSFVAEGQYCLQMHIDSKHGEGRPHVCEFCGKAFKLPNNLACHLNLHLGNKRWKCDTCGEKFNQQAGLMIHVKRHHMGEEAWTDMCHLCSEKFISKSDLIWHLYRAHEQPLPEDFKFYSCTICSFVTKSRTSLERHSNAHEGIKKFTCSICEKTLGTKSQLKKHESFHGEKSFKCTYYDCNYACVDSIGLEKHVKLMHTHKDLKPYICPVCHYKTGVKGNLDKHIRQVHNLIVVSKHTVPLKMKYPNFESGDIITHDGELIATAKRRKELYQQCVGEVRRLRSDCNIMEVSFDELDVSLNVSLHAESGEEDSASVGHSLVADPTEEPQAGPSMSRDDNKNSTKRQVFTCESCTYRSHHRANMYRHKMAVHVKRKYKCDICSKEYHSRYYLQEHIYSKHQHIQFLCEICSHSFNTRRALNNHKERMHTRKNKFECGYCGKIMFDCNNYHGHINKHMKVKAYKCTTCSKGFYYESSLKRHAITCKDDRDKYRDKYKCQECDKSFKSTNTLNDHVKGKHGPKTQVCRCGKVFAWRTSLSRHAKTCKIWK